MSAVEYGPNFVRMDPHVCGDCQAFQIIGDQEVGGLGHPGKCINREKILFIFQGDTKLTALRKNKNWEEAEKINKGSDPDCFIETDPPPEQAA